MLRLGLFFGIAIILLVFVFTLFFDRPIALYFHDQHFSFFKALTTLGNAAPWLILSLCLMILYKKSDPKLYQKAFYFFASVAVSGILVDILKPIIGKARPKLLFEEGFYGMAPMSFKASFWSMPSGHSATALAVGVALALLYPRFRYLFLTLAILVVVSRVILTKHYLSDVLVGATIGALTALWLYQRMCRAKC